MLEVLKLRFCLETLKNIWKKKTDKSPAPPTILVWFFAAKWMNEKKNAST